MGCCYSKQIYSVLTIIIQVHKTVDKLEYNMCSAQIMGTESVAYTHKNKGSCFLF